MHLDLNFLDDDVPTPKLSEYSDEEEIVVAAESLLDAKSESMSSDIQITEINPGPYPDKDVKSPKSLLSTANLSKQTEIKSVIPKADPMQVHKIKRLLETVRDDLEEVVFKKSRLSDIYEEAKALEEKSQLHDMDFETQPSVIEPPPNSETLPLDDTLVEMMQEHISELQDKIKNSVNSRKFMFAAIEGLESTRGVKDTHFRESFSSNLGAPLDQLKPLLNDSTEK